MKMPQPKRRMSEAQMEKKTQRDSDRINQFQQKKLAEQLAIGMAVRNATLEQLGTKSKKKRSLRPLQRLLVKKLLHGLPSVLNKSNSIPHVHCAIRYPSRSKLLLLSKFNSKRIVPSATVMWSSCAL